MQQKTFGWTSGETENEISMFSTLTHNQHHKITQNLTKPESYSKRRCNCPKCCVTRNVWVWEKIEIWKLFLIFNYLDRTQHARTGRAVENETKFQTDYVLVHDEKCTKLDFQVDVHRGWWAACLQWLTRVKTFQTQLKFHLHPSHLWSCEQTLANKYNIFDSNFNFSPGMLRARKCGKKWKNFSAVFHPFYCWADDTQKSHLTLWRTLNAKNMLASKNIVNCFPENGDGFSRV